MNLKRLEVLSDLYKETLINWCINDVKTNSEHWYSRRNSAPEGIRKYRYSRYHEKSEELIYTIGIKYVDGLDGLKDVVVDFSTQDDRLLIGSIGNKDVDNLDCVSRLSELINLLRKHVTKKWPY